EPIEMIVLLAGQLPKDPPAAEVARQLGRARVEFPAAPLGGNGDAQRVAREQDIGWRAASLGGHTGPAAVTDPVDLHHALLRRKPAGRRDLLDHRLDVRAQKLDGLLAGLADQMKVPGMPVRVLEPEPAFAEV